MSSVRLDSALCTATGSTTTRTIGDRFADVDGKEANGGTVRVGRFLADEYLRRVEALGLVAEKHSVITRVDANTLRAYRPLGGRFWQEVEFSTGGIANGPYSWNRTRLIELVSYVLSRSSSWTYSGTWDTPLTSGDPNTYIGGQTNWCSYGGTNPYAEATLTFGGDLYLIFVGRTSGGYVKVEIDGDTEKANALPLHASGYRYVDTYTAVDLQYKQRVKVATGLPYASHVVRFTPMNDRNPANVSGQSRLYFNGLGVVSRDQGLPYQADTRIPLWTTGTVYGAYAQVGYGANSYYTVAGGTSGATPPTHTGGSASDGGVTWVYMTASSYDLAAQTIQAPGSQLEYAYQIKPTGATSLEDVGGVVHGNETLVSSYLDVDGDRVATLAANTWLSGDRISFVQDIDVTHSEIGGGATVINDTTLIHELSPRGITVSHRHVWNVAGEIGWSYAAMWPLAHWYVGTTAEHRYFVDQMFTPQGGKVSPASYYGQSNPIVGKTPDFIMLAWGDVLMEKGTAGGNSAIGPLTAVAGLYVTPQSVDEYRDAGNVYAGMAANIAGVTAPGSSSDIVKLYFERSPDTPRAPVAVGEEWSSRALYLLRLVASSTHDPT